MTATIRRRVIVHGFVQGVFFRGSMRDEADARGVKGWVRNRPDGTVEAVFEGDAQAVSECVAYCGSGPPGARVDDVDVADEEPTGDLLGFRVT